MLIFVFFGFNFKYIFYILSIKLYILVKKLIIDKYYYLFDLIRYVLDF